MHPAHCLDCYSEGYGYSFDQYHYWVPPIIPAAVGEGQHFSVVLRGQPLWPVAQSAVSDFPTVSIVEWRVERMLDAVVDN